MKLQDLAEWLKKVIMAIIKSPLFSLGASGSVGKNITFSKGKKNYVVGKRIQRKDSETPLQIGQRDTFLLATESWNQLTEQEKESWKGLARTRLMTGYNLFIQNYLNNPPPPVVYGVYGITKYDKCQYI